MTRFIVFMLLFSSFLYGEEVCGIFSGIKGELQSKIIDIACKGYRQIKGKRAGLMVVIDYTKPSSRRRFFVIDLKHQKLLHRAFVAHGKNSGYNYARKFSNIPDSKQSSPGFFLTKGTYYGKHGYSLKLKGLERGLNDLAERRAIVIHGAKYVSEEMINRYGRLGRSWGCPALERGVSKEIINLIKNGVLIYIHTDDARYQRESDLIK